MDISRCIKLLEQKNVILVCADSHERCAVVELLTTHLKEEGYQIFQLPEGIKSGEKYLQQALKHFPIQSPLKIPKDQMGLDQVNDVQLDWLVPGKKTAIVIPEIQKLKKNEGAAFLNLLGTYLTASFRLRESGDKTSFRFVLSLNELAENDLEGLQLFVGRKATDTRTVHQIAEDHIAVYRYPEPATRGA